MAIRNLCTAVILLASFYAWLMTATGLQLTQYRPAFGGLIGNAQPYVLAALVHAAITLFYLRLASHNPMARREKTALVLATPLIVVFTLWAIFMASYSIMFERREATARVESGNQLQAIAEELRTIDRQMAGQFVALMANLDQRLEHEINSPDPGVRPGCGPRCREIRALKARLENFQHLCQPALSAGAPPAMKDLGQALGTLENEYHQVALRYGDFEIGSKAFGSFNSQVARRLAAGTGTNGGDGGAGLQARQTKERLDRMQAGLVDLRENERNLTDPKYRGLTELVDDISIAIKNGKMAQVLDLSTVLLIAVAPDIIALAMALLSRTFVRDEVPSPFVPWGRTFWRGLLRSRPRLAEPPEIDSLRGLITEQLSYRVSGLQYHPSAELGAQDLTPANQPPPANQATVDSGTGRQAGAGQSFAAQIGSVVSLERPKQKSRVVRATPYLQ